MHMHEMAAEGFEGKYDAAFMSVLQDVGQIQPFLDAVFSFLGRRTDFYLALSDDGKFGFAPGVAENVVKKVSALFRPCPAFTYVRASPPLNTPTGVHKASKGGSDLQANRSGARCGTGSGEPRRPTGGQRR